MQAQTDIGLPLSIRFAHQLNRFLSWGMAHEFRESFLSEGLADWEEMHRDRGSISVLLRALRGVPTAVWARFDEHDTTALPAAVAITLLGVAGVAAGLLETAYPMDTRRFALLSAFGTFLMGATLIRDPRRLVLRRYRLSALLLGAGFIGMAANLPPAEAWAYDVPLAETAVIDGVLAVGFSLVGIGFALVVLASFVSKRLLTYAGIAIMVGTALFAGAQIAWGITAVTVDPAITVTSVAVGLASLSLLHVVPRIRKLKIV